ncbi:hypothetical protein OQA88_12750 [Cercophora sp. LCS_1]
MTMYRSTTGAMPSDNGNNRHASYQAYLNSQGAAGTQHDGSAHGQQVNARTDGLGAVMNQFSSLSLPSGPTGSNLSHVQAAHGYCPPDQGVAYQGYHVPLPVGMAPEGPYPFNLSGQFPIQGGFAPMPVPYHNVPYTPGRVTSYADRYVDRYIDRSTSDVPSLENRRGSYSTTESAPATPFFGSASERAASSRALVIPSSYTTPSPEQAVAPAPVTKIEPVDEELLALLKEQPAIPDAVPAVFTPPTHVKSIEQCLENRINGNRNVYIRGLHPTTDDELLLQYASRFGKVEQSKAIIDTATGACKGFGFAKFADVRDSEKCIRGFYQLGYEVGFARESFNARLKAEGDECSTNLYLSNLPKNLNEAELNAIFINYNVVSSKILRDSMGNSRGVGFARFESREECEEVIKKYHGACIGEEGLMMQVRYADTPRQKDLKRGVVQLELLASKALLTGQVRYADTPAQKELKRITAERRQFRTNEYNIGAYGTADVGIHPSIYQQGSWNRRAASAMSVLAPLYWGDADTTSSFAPRAFSRGAIEFPVTSPAAIPKKQSTSVSGAVTSDDGSGDEGVTVADQSTIANASTQSSPTVKREKS